MKSTVPLLMFFIFVNISFADDSQLKSEAQERIDSLKSKAEEINKQHEEDKRKTEELNNKNKKSEREQLEELSPKTLVNIIMQLKQRQIIDEKPDIEYSKQVGDMLKEVASLKQKNTVLNESNIALLKQVASHEKNVTDVKKLYMERLSQANTAYDELDISLRESERTVQNLKGIISSQDETIAVSKKSLTEKEEEIKDIKKKNWDLEKDINKKKFWIYVFVGISILLFFILIIKGVSINWNSFTS